MASWELSMLYSQQALADLHAWGAEHGISDGRISERLRTGSVGLRDTWNAGSKDPDKYYREECADEYVYDLTAWHASGTINGWFEAVKTNLMHRKPGRLLDYGAGIGTYSLIAADLGWEVDACDINQPNLDYIAWRMTRHNLWANLVTKPTGTYAAIICVDTIEHLPQPQTFPQQAHTWLSTEGMLLATWTFHQSGGMHPMHNTDALPAFLQELQQYFRIDRDTWPVCLEKI